MEFRLLGTLEVRAGDELLPLGPPKQRALLALFLLHANQVLARERLIDELWGEEPPDTAVKALQGYISRIRKLLPEGTLLTRSPGYLLEVEPEAVDALRFERLVAGARGAEPARAASLLREALGLWRGPALSEFGDEPFARVEAARLEELRLAALEARIEADLALGRHADLVGELEVLIAELPQREHLRGQLMLALYRSGRQPEALEAYREARALLATLGLEPGEALRQLEKRILTQDRALQLSRTRLLAGERVALPGALVPTPPFPFVAREAELASLRVLLERAEGGEGSLVLLAAEAGGGKTRLVRELAHEAAARGVIVLYGAADAAVSIPYQPLREWLEFLLRVCDPEALAQCVGDHGATLSPLAPELLRLTGTPSPSDSFEPDRHLLQSAAVEVLRRVSRLQPLLLLADDIHWGDDETLQLLRRLARAAPEVRMLIVATYRDRGEEIGPAPADTLADLSRLDGVTRCSLGGLSDDDVGALIGASADAEVSVELASAMRELTHGTPLLVCELWRDLRESSAVEVSDGRVQLTRPLDELRGAERLADVVRQRLSRLAPPTAVVVELAAVAGARFELRVVAVAAGLDGDSFAVAVAEAVRKGFIEELPEPVPAGRFTHELVRRVVYERVTGTDRSRRHLRVGEALERMHAGDPGPALAELAHHFTLAAPVGGPARGIDYNLRAADAAVMAAAFGEAAARLSAALELGIADQQERARVQLELAYVLQETGRFMDAEATLAASLDAETGLEERGHAAAVLMQRVSQDMYAADADPAHMQKLTERALETFSELGDPYGLAHAGRLHGLTLRRQGRVADACAAIEQALVHATASGRRRLRRSATATLSFALYDGPTPVPDAIRRCEELQRGNEDDRVLQAGVDRCLAPLLAMAGRFDEASVLVVHAGLVLDRLGTLTTSYTHRRASAETKELLGDRAGAEEDLAASFAWFRDLRDSTVPDIRAMQPAYLLALLCCSDSRWDDAERLLEYGRDAPRPGPDSFRAEAALRLAAEAQLAAHRGDSEGALTLAESAVACADASDLLNLRARLWRVLAEVRQAAGQPADAALAEALRLYEAKGNVAAAAYLRAAAAT